MPEVTFGLKLYLYRL